MARKRVRIPKTQGPAVIDVANAHKTLGTNLVPYAMHYSYGYFAGPDRKHLEKYEIAFRTDPIISRALDYIMRSMISSLGDYVHSDNRAVRYVNEMRDSLEGNLEQQLGELIISALWSGVGISEKVFEHRKGKVWLKKLNNYHPRSMIIVPNNNGELTQGQNVSFHPIFEKSGVYQEIPWIYVTKGIKPKGQLYQNYVKLPLEKLVIVGHNRRHGNWDGESALAPVYLRYQMALETWQNAMITTERYGSPQLAAIVPHGLTSQKIDLPDGGFRYKTVAEAAAEAMSNLSASSALVFEEPYAVTGKEAIRLQNVSTFNNFGDNFLSIIKYLYSDILVGLGVPPLLFLEHGEGLGAGAVSKVHAETYKQLLIALYKEFIEPFCEQVIGQLLYWNFGITDPGQFVFTPYDIEASNTLMMALGAANTNGVLDMSEEEDLQYSRAKMGFPLASQDTISRRLKNNKRLMDAIRTPDGTKAKMADAKNDTQLQATQIQANIQDKMNKRSTDTQKQIAEQNNQAKHQTEKEKTKQAAMGHEQVMSGKAAQLEKAKAQAVVAKQQAKPAPKKR